MTTKTKMIPVNVYYTPDGAPTCAKKWETGEVCRFLVSDKIEFENKCKTSDLSLKRRWDGGRASIEPHKDCELHNE